MFHSNVNGHRKKKKPWKTGASSGYITNLKQSILRLLISLELIEGSTKKVNKIKFRRKKMKETTMVYNSLYL